MQVGIHAVTRLDDAFLPRWRALATSALEPNPFFEPAMALAAARRLPGGEDDRLLVVEDGGEPRLVLPLRALPGYRRIRLPALIAWGHQHSYLGTPLVAREAAAEAIGAALGHLGEGPADWLVLESSPADGRVRAQIGAALAARGVTPVSILPFERPVLQRTEEGDYLARRLSGRRRKELRRLRRRLAEQLGAEPETTEVVAAGGDVEGALETLLRLEGAGWKGAAGTALSSRPEDAAFFRDAMEAFAAEGRLRVWTLGAAGRVAAVAVGVVAGDVVFHLKIAFDETLGEASPGTLLEVDLLDAFHAEPGAAWLDPCTDGGPSVSSRLYAGRRPMDTLLVPLSPVRGRAAAQLARVAVRARGAMERARPLAARDR